MAADARWSLPEIDATAVAQLASRCGVHPPAARVLWSRGYRDPSAVDHFLHPKLSDLGDPFLLAQMETAVARLQQAIRSREPVLIYGDYDVDGTSSIVILRTMLEKLGACVRHYIPDRLKDGYGIRTSVIEDAHAEGIRLLISVDTGIRAIEPLARARDLGMDVIVTDHHLPEAELPPATAILNPNRPDCAYPNKNLCGAGVTFKLIQALMERELWPPDRIVRFSDSFLVLVAMATVADVVPLTGENRVIVKRGLEGLTRTRNPGLRALLKEAGIGPGDPISATDVGFRVSPRINAAGRMDHAGDVVELFLTQDDERAREIAARLDALNAERQRTCEAVAEEIMQLCGARAPGPDEAGLVFYNPDWHRGVVGIVASRIVEAFHRPAIVLGRDEASGLAQGSGRSVPGFHILEALESMPELFERFGGHRSAVGMTLAEERIPELRERFNAYARQALSDEELVARYDFDAPLSLAELHDASAAQILQLAPFGLGNRAPLFFVQGVTLQHPPEFFGRDREHLRLRLPASSGRVVHAKAWKFAGRSAEVAPGQTVDLALTVEADNYSLKRGFSAWSATVRDVRPSAKSLGLQDC